MELRKKAQLERGNHVFESRFINAHKKTAYKGGFFKSISGGCGRNRTGVDGFAGHCITILLRSHTKNKKAAITRLFENFIGAGNGT